MKRSARVLGLGFFLLVLALPAGGALAYLVVEEPYPGLLDQRAQIISASVVAFVLLVAVLCVWSGLLRIASHVDRIAEETQAIGRWTRLVGSDFPDSAVKNGRQVPKTAPEPQGGAAQRHARQPQRPASSGVRPSPLPPLRREPTTDGDGHRRRLAEQYRADHARS